MRVINISEKDSSAMCYSQIPQPMYVYHSQEEFLANVRATRQLVTGPADYYDFITRNNLDLTYNSNNKYVNVVDLDIWIKTIDKFVPSHADFSGLVHHVGEEENNLIPTDGVYIQLFFITPTPTRHVLFTSSGVHSVGMTKWQPTGAIRYNYSQESDPRRGMDKSEIYKERLEKILRKRAQSVQSVKIVMALFNPISKYFCDFDGIMKRVVPWIKADDRQKYLQTESFRSTIMAVFKILYPELAPAVREKHSPEVMAAKLEDMFEIAKKSGNIKDMVLVYEKIVALGYEENALINDTTGKVIKSGYVQLPENAESAKQPLSVSDTDKFLDNKDGAMTAMIPGIELSEEEVKASYPSSFIEADPDEILKSLQDE